MKARLAAVLALLAACSFERPADVPDDDTGDDDSGQTPDAEVPDSELGCTPSTTTCTDGRYVECSAEGVVTRAIDCSLGCDGSQPKCREIDASNGVSQYLDQARTDPTPMLRLGAGSTIDTDSGVIFDGGANVSVPNIDLGGFRVFMVKSLSIEGTTTVSGGDSLIFVSAGDISITATLDISANGQVSGPGGGAGTCEGGDATFQTSVGYGGGGGGGGNGEAGGVGAGAFEGPGNTPGGAAGAALAAADLVPLRGGCFGGESIASGTTCKSIGGGGGGAVQLTSRTRIVISGNGVIDASGGGGIAARSGQLGCNIEPRGGGGGGSGGSILLEAPLVTLDGAGVVLSTKGGGGSASGNGSIGYAGADGGTTAAPAAGGTSTNGAPGGKGGTDSVPPEEGPTGTSGQSGGAGGGAAGRVRFNTADGSWTAANGAAVRSKHTSSQLRVRLVP
jgi:hypothetical protein